MSAGGGDVAQGGAADVLVAYADHVQGLPIGADAKRHRRNAATSLLAAHPDLDAWMMRPTPARLADLRRSGAWPFLCWCFLDGRLRPDLDLLVTKLPGDLYATWAQPIAATSTVSMRSPTASAGARTGGVISSPAWRWCACGRVRDSTS